MLSDGPAGHSTPVSDAFILEAADPSHPAPCSGGSAGLESPPAPPTPSGVVKPLDR